MRFLRSESYKKGIFLSIALNIIAKALAFINSIAIAFFFGAQSKIDIYFYCYATVGLFVAFIGSLDSSVIIPEAMRIREQDGVDKEKYFLNYFLYLYTGIGILTVLLLLIDPVRILSCVSNFDVHNLEKNHSLILWFIPICLLMLITTYLTNVLSSYKYFTIPIMAGIVNNIFSVLFLISFHGLLDVKSIVMGLGFGYLVNIFILLFIMKRQLNWQFRMKKIHFDSRLKKNIKYAFSGNITSFFSGYAPFYIMSNFNPGVVTMFNYAKSLAEIPNQMITSQFSSVSGIKFNTLSAQKKYGELNDLFIESTGFLIFLMTPVCGILFLFSEEIIAFLYQRGAFDTHTVKQTAFILKYLSFSVVYFVINTMVSRLFMASQKLRESFWYQIYMNIIFILFVSLASFRFGIDGFIAGTLTYQIIVIVFTYWLMKKYFTYINYLKILQVLIANIILNLTLIVGFSLLNKKIESFSLTIVYIAIYFLIVFVFNQSFQIERISRQFCSQIIKRILTLTSVAFSKAKV